MGDTQNQRKAVKLFSFLQLRALTLHQALEVDQGQPQPQQQ